MPISTDDSWGGAISELMTQASAVLTRESSRGYPDATGPGAAPAPPASSHPAESLLGIAARICPVTGAAVPVSPPDPSRLRQQAHELLNGLLGSAGQPGQHSQGTSDATHLRRQVHELIETFWATFGGGGPRERQEAPSDRVPLLRAGSPVQAGTSSRVGFRVANEEDSPSDVTLYCTDFISDGGHEIPALRVTMVPRRANIPPKRAADFQIEVAVPQQMPPGFYSGLIQAMGNRYVKAVVMIEVT